MNNFRRVTIFILLAAISLFTGVLFWPFILNNIITPTSLVVWLLLRIFVLSIDQIYFWAALIFAVVVFLVRLLPQEQPAFQSDAYMETNATIKTIGYWRVLFTYNDQNIRDEKILKRELIHLLTSLFASKQSASTNFSVFNDLQQGEIPLPEHIHAFLFSEEPQELGGSIKKFLKAIRKTPRKWLRKWTGQELAEHYQMIDEVLNFMETTLEIKNDER